MELHLNTQPAVIMKTPIHSELGWKLAHMWRLPGPFQWIGSGHKKTQKYTVLPLQTKIGLHQLESQ